MEVISASTRSREAAAIDRKVELFKKRRFPLNSGQHIRNRAAQLLIRIKTYLYYQVSPKLRCSLGMELVTNKLYLRPDKPDMPKKMEISELSENFGLFADLQTTKKLSFNFGLGATVPFYSRLRESGYNRTYMRMYDHVRPFVKLQMKYSIK